MSPTLRKLVSSTLLLTISVMGFAMPRLACAGESFDRGEIQNAMKDYYDYYAHRDPSEANLEDGDRSRMARVMARQLIVLNANLFNDVIGNMIAIDYRHSPGDRAAIEALTQALEAEGERDQIFKTVKDARTSAILTVISDAFVVWGLVYAWGFRNGWAGGEGLQGIERFNYALKAATEEMPETLRAKLAVAGIGTAVGVAHAAYDYLYRTRFDPLEALEKIQDQIVTDLAIQAARYRKTLRSDLASRALPNPKRLRASAQQLGSMEDQVLHLSRSAPEYDGRLSPVAEDISASQMLIRDLEAREPGARRTRPRY